MAPELSDDEYRTLPISSGELAAQGSRADAAAAATIAVKPRRIAPAIIGAAVVFGIGAIVVIGLILTGLNGTGPLAMLRMPFAMSGHKRKSISTI